LLNHDQLTIRVSDTGMGIHPDNLNRIFTAFKQEDSTISRRFGGTGLGLSISLNMIRLLAGDILIRCQLEKDSCFTEHVPFNLPVGKRVANTPEDTIPARLAPVACTTPLRP